MSVVYGFELDRDLEPLTLPSEGDANQCGRVEILEANAEYTRLAFTLCHEPGWGRATWTIGLPRGIASFDRQSGLPEPYRVTHVVSSLDGTYRLEWDLDDAVEMSVATFATEDPAFTRGRLEAWMRQPDPRSSFRQAEARLEVVFEILHPVLP